MKSTNGLIPIITIMIVLPAIMMTYEARSAEGTYYPGNPIDNTPVLSGHFTENLGQWDEAFDFIGDTSSGHIGFGPNCFYIHLNGMEEPEGTQDYSDGRS